MKTRLTLSAKILSLAVLNLLLLGVTLVGSRTGHTEVRDLEV